MALGSVNIASGAPSISEVNALIAASSEVVVEDFEITATTQTGMGWAFTGKIYKIGKLCIGDAHITTTAYTSNTASDVPFTSNFPATGFTPIVSLASGMSLNSNASVVVTPGTTKGAFSIRYRNSVNYSAWNMHILCIGISED